MLTVVKLMQPKAQRPGSAPPCRGWFEKCPRYARMRGQGRSIQILLIAVLLAICPQVRAHDNRGDGDPANDWIEGYTDSQGTACCGNNDCYPLTPGALKFSAEDGFSVVIGGKRFSVPKRSLVPDSSPDGRTWVCPKRVATAGGYMYTVRSVRCLLLPKGM